MDKISKHAFRYLSIIAVATIATGTIFYHLVEKLGWIDAYYFSVITLSTVGYGDISPQTTVGKLFTTIYILIGVGILTTFISALIRRRATVRQEKWRKDNTTQ